jgi:hypothetical protein
MAAPQVLSDEQLFQLTGNWEAAAALRDAQYNAANEYNASQVAPTTGGLLSGNILAGASWNSANTALQDALTEATGQATSNYAVGGSTTTDTLNQLNTYLAGGGQFDANATVFLQAGGVDFIQGVDRAVVKDNLNQIVKTLGDRGVNVVLTGSPYAASVQDVVNNNFDSKIDSIYNDVAKANKNVALVNTQGEILKNKALLVDALHTNAEGTSIYNQSVIDAMSQFKNEVPSSTPQAIAQTQKTNTVATTANSLAPNIQNLIASGALQPNQATLIGDTYYQPVYSQTGSGMDAQLGQLENVITYKAGDNKVGGEYKQYTPTGELERTGTQQEVNATKDFMNFALTAGTLFGLPANIGQSLGLGSGAASQAIGQGLLTTGTKLGGGESLGDALKAGLLSGGLVYGGTQLGDYIKANTPIDASNMTSAQFNDALETQLISEMQAAGLSKDQINAFFDNMGIGQGLTTATTTPVVDSAIPSATDTVSITGAKPTTVGIGDVFATTPTLTVTGKAQTPTTQQDVINAIAAVNSNIAGTPTATTPELVIKDAAVPKTTIGDTLAAITTLPITTPVTTTPKTTTPDTTKETDPLKVIQLGLAAAGLLGVGSALSSDNGATQYPIVPIPEDWKTPPKTGVAPFTPLTPIDFGNRNLLMGTQWEKFLDPNYGQVPKPVQYSQPSNMSYNDLMGILGSKQGMPSASSLSINDIISGIQNQYGQANRSAMG